jgi:hypothetical protein
MTIKTVLAWKSDIARAFVMHCKTDESHAPHKFTKKESGLMQMLFHPTAFRSEFCNPLTFGHIHLSCAFCALPGWNMTQKIRLLLNHWSILPSHSMQYFILIGWRAQCCQVSTLFSGQYIKKVQPILKMFGQYHKISVATYTWTKSLFTIKLMFVVDFLAGISAT